MPRGGPVDARSLREFLATEAGSAGLLLVATLVALVWANSPFAGSYRELWATDLHVGLGALGAIDFDLRHWVNDGLMAVFFCVVGLEIRRELAVGELRDRRAAAVPAIAALAGMVAPALLYTVITAGGPGARGWGIVMATDIAFVLGALAVLGNRIPSGVRVFLLTLAIVDDLGAIAVIAAFYGHGLETDWLAAAAAIVLASWGALRLGRAWSPWAYGVVGAVLWFVVLQSGIHATIAGVAIGFLAAVHPPRVGGRPSCPSDAEFAAAAGEPNGGSVPISAAERRQDAGVCRPVDAGGEPHSVPRETSLAEHCEDAESSDRSANERITHALHPWSSFVIVPLFALANAGVELGDGRIGAALGSTVTIAVIAGLVVGKALGITAATLAAVRGGVGPLPTGVRPGHVRGAATLAGIGFTVSLFVAELAFTDPLLRDQAKIGVLAASMLAAAVGLALLARRGR